MVRYLEREEKQNIKALYDECFHDSIDYTDYYFNQILPKADVAVCEKDNEIISSMQIIPKTAVVGNLKTDLRYIYGVGTLRLYRSEGFMRKVMEKVVHDLYRNLDAFTYLIPSDEINADIYRKFGFEYVMDKPIMKPIASRKKATHSLMLRRADVQDMVKLSIFAQTTTEKRYKVTLSKNMDYFKHIESLIKIEGGYVELYISNMVIMGYRIWIGDEIFEEVLDSSIASMSYFDQETRPFAMARILNIRKTLRLLGFKGEGVKIIKITDPVLEENTGTFRLAYRGGDIKIIKLSDDEEPDVDVTINELTAHVFGYSTIEGLPKVCDRDSFFINDYV